MPYHRKTREQFIKEAWQKHGDKYDYAEVVYVNTHTPVKIQCQQCGNYFFQEPSSHLAGHGCPKCRKKWDYRKLSQEDFIARVRMVHGDKYDYSKTEYKFLSCSWFVLSAGPISPPWSWLPIMQARQAEREDESYN